MTTSRARRFLLSLPVMTVTVMVTAGGAGVAKATEPVQDAAVPQAVASSNPLGDIVVTARRRAESGQTVPITVQALSADALRQNSVRGLTDLTQLVPGFRATPTGPDTNTDFTQRGLARAPGGDGSPAVVTYFAEVPLSQDATLVPTYDIANIQVLKGPQGTLFGRNAIGGAVLITPQAPTFKLGGYAQAALGDLSYRFLEGALNVPVVDDVLAFRVAGQLEKRDGFATNEVSGQKVGDINRRSVRASVLFTPTSNIRNTLVVDYMKIAEAGRPMIPLELFSDPVTGASPIGVAAFYQCGTSISCDINLQLARQKEIGDRKFYSNVPYSSDATLWGAENKTEIDIGDLTLRNIAGYRSSKIFTDSSAGVDLVPELLDSSASERINQYSDELQLTGKAFDRKLNWIVGAFYLEYDPTTGTRTTVLAPAPWIPNIEKRTNYAFFGQADYDLSAIAKGLKIEAGVRYNWDKEKLCSLPTEPGSQPRPTFDPNLCTGTSDVTYNGHAPTWTVGLNYQVTSHVLLYVTSRRGYREGGLNAPLFNAPEQAVFRPYQTVKPEKLTDVEAGIKSDWSVGNIRGRLNISAYKQWLHGYQQTVAVAGLVPTAFLPTNSSLTVNGGDLSMSGFDVEASVRPFDGLTLTDNTSYFHLDSIKVAIPDALNPTGVPFPVTVSTPKWSTNLTLNYVLPFHPTGGDISLNVNYFYSGAIHYQALTLPHYDLTDLRLQFSNIGRTGFGVAGFIRNVFNKDYLVSAEIFQTSFGLGDAAYAPPRTFGVEVSYRF